MVDHLLVRTASVSDAPAMLDIYAPYVRDTAITFEYDVPSAEEFTERVTKTLERYPWIVAQGGIDGSAILGYAYTGAFKNRAAYDWSVETSIYVRSDSRRGGVGRALYDALERISLAQHVTNLNACIACPSGPSDEHLDRNSIDFHTHMGYRLVGEFHECGYKFGRWYNMVWMEKAIAPHDASPLPFVPFSQLSGGM